MAPDIDDFDLETMTDLVVVNAGNVLPDDDYTRGSDNWSRGRVLASVATDLHAAVKTADRDSQPLSARGVKLEGWANTYGLQKLGATPASGEDVGLIRGEDGASWTTSDALVHPQSGRRYFPTESGTLDALEQALVGIISEDGGSATRLNAGDVLQWESTPTDLEDEVELQAALTAGGLDQETEGGLRNRTLTRTANPAAGGTATDYELWARQSASYIATAYVWRGRNGRGSVDIAALKEGRGSARLLTLSERNALFAYVDERRPISVGDVRVLEVVAEPANVSVILEPRPLDQFARDWSDATPPEVLSWNSSTRLLTFTAARPTSMAVGHRIVVASTSGEEAVIESLSSTAAVVLRAPVPITPVAGQLVYSGGPIIAPARNRILALIDSLGPRVGEFGTGLWEGTLRIAQLRERIQQTSEGVLDHTIVAPVANVEGTELPFPLDDQIGLVTPGNVFVRYIDL